MKLILFQGDSITDNGRSREDESFLGNGYPTLLSSQLSYEHPGEYRFLDRGQGGNRIVDLYARFKTDIINLKPDIVSILIGVNDVWHELTGHNGVAADKFEIIYDLMISEIREALPATQILLMEPYVLPGKATVDPADSARWDTFAAEVPLRAAAVRSIARKHGLPCLSLQDKFDAALEKAPCEVWLKDGVHPTDAGHELIAREWLKAFQEFL